MEIYLKQKSPPVGGQAVDDRFASRSVAPSRRKVTAAPPEADGRSCSDGDQVRHRIGKYGRDLVWVNRATG
jgi:hypothetical protein